MCGGFRTTWWNHFPCSITLFPGIKLSSSALASSSLTHWAISVGSALHFNIYLSVNRHIWSSVHAHNGKWLHRDSWHILNIHYVLIWRADVHCRTVFADCLTVCVTQEIQAELSCVVPAQTQSKVWASTLHCCVVPAQTHEWSVSPSTPSLCGLSWTVAWFLIGLNDKNLESDVKEWKLKEQQSSSH